MINQVLLVNMLWQCIAASDGVAIAKAYLLVEPDLSFTNEKITDTDAEILGHQVQVNVHQK
jgi:phosphoenolpyruvate-protein kinase (PTS system EI component)